MRSTVYLIVYLFVSSSRLTLVEKTHWNSSVHVCVCSRACGWCMWSACPLKRRLWHPDEGDEDRFACMLTRAKYEAGLFIQKHAIQPANATESHASTTGPGMWVGAVHQLHLNLTLPLFQSLPRHDSFKGFPAHTHTVILCLKGHFGDFRGYQWGYYLQVFFH